MAHFAAAGDRAVGYCYKRDPLDFRPITQQQPSSIYESREVVNKRTTAGDVFDVFFGEAMYRRRVDIFLRRRLIRKGKGANRKEREDRGPVNVNLCRRLSLYIAGLFVGCAHWLGASCF